MEVTGLLTRNTIPGESADHIFVLRYEGVPVIVIDDDGNLKIWGDVSQEDAVLNDQ